MMPQKEDSEAIHQQADPEYGRYEDKQTPSARQPKIVVGSSVFYDWRYEGKQTSSAGQHDETSYEQLLREGPVGKVYPEPRDNKNILRLIVFAIAMVTLLAFAVLCLVFVGGTGGWVSFCAASSLSERSRYSWPVMVY